MADLLTVFNEHIYKSLDVGGETIAFAMFIVFDKAWQANFL